MPMDRRTILLVEDNEDDVFIFERVYQRTRLPHPVRVVSTGQAALDYLRGAGAFADREGNPTPFLVLLDLKLPSKSGLEVLQAIRSSPDFDRICVVVLTSSAELRDVARARELGAHAFLVKPPSAKMLADTVLAVRDAIESADPFGVRVRMNISGNLLA